MRERIRTLFFPRATTSSPSTCGFTLVEVIVAMMLLGLISLSLTTTFTFAVMNTRRAGIRRQEMAVAQTAAEHNMAGSANAASANTDLRMSPSNVGRKVTIAFDGYMDIGEANFNPLYEVTGSFNNIAVTDGNGNDIELQVFVPSRVSR